MVPPGGALAPRPEPAATRVMLVDDSAVVRGLVSRWLGEVPGLAVVGGAADGQSALDQLDALRPDLLLLDLDMPGLDGLAALPRLLSRRPGLSVVVMSTLTQRNAAISQSCLALGAVDYIPKPVSASAATLSRGYRDEVKGRVAALADAHRRRAVLARGDVGRGQAETVRPGPRLVAALPRPGRVPVQLLAVASSTGGPRAVIELLTGLGPAAAEVPILLVQHMPALFTGAFAELIGTETKLPVAVAKAGEVLVRGRVYVAPGDCHLGLELNGSGSVVTRLEAGAMVNHCRPAADILFRDAARIFGAGVAAVVLTGMGSDGAEGARAVAEAGGRVLAQDEATSTVWGMPGRVAKAGLAEAVLPPTAIGELLATWSGARRR
jgi:two-component system, chemotaxis family, protein-glutamate methylesterase/glutaminase